MGVHQENRGLRQAASPRSFASGSFDWTFAPRVSVSYDPTGDGRQRISAFYGKYYDPIRKT